MPCPISELYGLHTLIMFTNNSNFVPVQILYISCCKPASCSHGFHDCVASVVVAASSCQSVCHSDYMQNLQQVTTSTNGV